MFAERPARELLRRQDAFAVPRRHEDHQTGRLTFLYLLDKTLQTPRDVLVYPTDLVGRAAHLRHIIDEATTHELTAAELTLLLAPCIHGFVLIRLGRLVIAIDEERSERRTAGGESVAAIKREGAVTAFAVLTEIAVEQGPVLQTTERGQRVPYTAR